MIRPSQPAFLVYGPSFAASGNALYHIGNGGTVAYNIGNHYNPSTSRFTAPVAGIYLFSAAARIHSMPSQSFVATWLRKNGANFASGFETNTTDGMATCVCMTPLAIGDYVEGVFMSGLNGTTDGTNNRLFFAGYLL